MCLAFLQCFTTSRFLFWRWESHNCWACLRCYFILFCLWSVCLQPFPLQALTSTHRWCSIRPTQRPPSKTALLQRVTGWPESLTHTWQQLYTHSSQGEFAALFSFIKDCSCYGTTGVDEHVCVTSPLRWSPLLLTASMVIQNIYLTWKQNCGSQCGNYTIQYWLLFSSLQYFHIIFIQYEEIVCGHRVRVTNAKEWQSQYWYTAA